MNGLKPAVLRDEAIPLYYQLETVLRNQILNGQLAPGQALPGETSLSRLYGVSRMTVRQALAALSRDGLIERRRGRGTFVSSSKPGYKTPRLTGPLEDIITVGILGVDYQVRLVEFTEVGAPREVAELLGVPADSRLTRIERVRLVEDSPLAVIVNYLPLDIGRRIEPQDLLFRSLVRIMEESLGLVLAEAVQRIEATIAGLHEAGLLEVRVGHPLLKMSRTVFDPAGRPLEFVIVLHRGDKYYYTVKLERGRPGQAKTWSTA